MSAQKAVIKCAHCPYTTNRPFNMTRHIQSRHKPVSDHVHKTSDDVYKMSDDLYKTSELVYKTSDGVYKTSDDQETENTRRITCEKCQRTFTRPCRYTEHIETCDGVPPGHCPICKKYFSNRKTLCSHKKACKPETALTTCTQAASQIVNITINNNIVNNNSMNVTNNVLSFPDADDGSFTFNTDKISKEHMKTYVTKWKAEIGFANFMKAVWDDPVNRIVRKSSPNVSYSQVHVGNGKWELAPDKDVYPVMTQFMTIAALDQMKRHEKNLRHMCDEFSKFVNLVNQDDECMQYQDVIQRSKLMVVNITREIEEAEKAAMFISSKIGI